MIAMPIIWMAIDAVGSFKKMGQGLKEKFNPCGRVPTLAQAAEAELPIKESIVPIKNSAAPVPSR